jgi:hypothetical protein
MQWNEYRKRSLLLVDLEPTSVLCCATLSVRRGPEKNPAWYLTLVLRTVPTLRVPPKCDAKNAA